MQSTRGRPALHTAMNLSALTLGFLALAGIALTGAYSTYAPTTDVAAGTSLVGPMLVAVLLVWGLAAACWIVARNTRPVPTAREQLAAIDSERERLAALRVAITESVVPVLYTTPADVAPVPSPRRRRARVKVAA